MQDLDQQIKEHNKNVRARIAQLHKDEKLAEKNDYERKRNIRRTAAQKDWSEKDRKKLLHKVDVEAAQRGKRLREAENVIDAERDQDRWKTVRRQHRLKGMEIERLKDPEVSDPKQVLLCRIITAAGQAEKDIDQVLEDADLNTQQERQMTESFVRAKGQACIHCNTSPCSWYQVNIFVNHLFDTTTDGNASRMFPKTKRNLKLAHALAILPKEQDPLPFCVVKGIFMTPGCRSRRQRQQDLQWEDDVLGPEHHHNERNTSSRGMYERKCFYTLTELPHKDEDVPQHCVTCDHTPCWANQERMLDIVEETEWAYGGTPATNGMLRSYAYSVLPHGFQGNRCPTCVRDVVRRIWIRNDGDSDDE